MNASESYIHMLKMILMQNYYLKYTHEIEKVREKLGLDLVLGQNNLNWLMPTPYFLQEENGQL